jgi:hypothetical protein
LLYELLQQGIVSARLVPRDAPEIGVPEMGLTNPLRVLAAVALRRSAVSHS